MSTTLLIGGRIHSPSHPYATAMAVEGDTVSWIGDDTPARALHPGARVVYLAGAFVAPAFVDPHVHVTDTGLSLIGLDLAGTRDAAECLTRLRRYAAEHPDAPVIWGHGWDESQWQTPAPPSATELDSAAPGRPVYLARRDEHSAIASTALLAAAGAAQDPRALPADDTAAILTGPLHDRVRSHARSLLDATQLRSARTAALDLAASKGIAEVHECGGPTIAGADDFQTVVALGEDPDRVGVRGYWGEAVTTPDDAAALLAARGAHALGGDLFLDGALGSHTAWLSEPYADHRGTGSPGLDADAAAAHLRACTQAGVQAGFHAIGDAAVAAACAAFATVASELGGPAVAGRAHRIEHLEMASQRQAEALGRLGVVASIQPMFDALWGGPARMYERRLGSHRAAAMNPFAALAAEGVALAVGSDSPVTPLDPWAAVRAAVHHSNPASSLSPRAAFTAATRGAWRAAGLRDGTTGTLVPGALASYAIWRTGDLVVAPSSRSIARWSTDPNSRVPALPDLSPGAPLPEPTATVRCGRTIFEAS